MSVRTIPEDLDYELMRETYLNHDLDRIYKFTIEEAGLPILEVSHTNRIQAKTNLFLLFDRFLKAFNYDEFQREEIWNRLIKKFTNG